MSTRIVFALLVSIALFSAGCGKKAPASPGPAVAEARESSPPPSNPAPPPAAAPAKAEPDIWSQDLATIDAWAKEKGFLGEVYFDFDRYELSAEARDRLTRNAEFLRTYPDVLVTVEGHCDERGTTEYNIALGDRRAHSALRFLEGLGVERARMRTVSYGEERPSCRQSNESCWSRNRRAGFQISGRRGT